MWITDVHVTDVDGSFGDFMLEEALVYMDGNDKEWITPPLFVSDLSSIPALLRPFIPKTILGKAPWLHDYLYRTQPEGVTRKRADQLFKEGALDEGMPHWKSHIMYRGLRLGGWMAWRKNKKLISSGVA
ncbi:MAG: hypothetical protein DRQ89_12460 [Epsilonproteobacteria bacterium]|nr:MAG: hypothetical protein DRQ89_12460 [Campylobacterota bacterium]